MEYAFEKQSLLTTFPTSPFQFTIKDDAHREAHFTEKRDTEKKEEIAAEIQTRTEDCIVRVVKPDT